MKGTGFNTEVAFEISMFKSGDYRFITEYNGKTHIKQGLALSLLTDNVTEELGYGGAAGGAKSWTGCSWITMMAVTYPDTKWFIGREELTRLMGSTYVTLQKVFKAYGLRNGIDWIYNGQYHYVMLSNGSRIDFLDLKLVPRDPFYERFGSLEYTGGWIEEGGEVNFGAYDTLKTRVGRHNNDKYGILGKLLVTLNPKKKTTEVASAIKSLAYKHKIPMSHVVVDEDGVGGGVVDELGCKGFVNGSSPLSEPATPRDQGKKVVPNYLNLRSQCYYRLSARVNEKGVYVACQDYEIREMLSDELEQIKKKDVDNDQKLQVVAKKEMKEQLGRSPDFADTIMMRDYFELKPKYKAQNLEEFFFSTY